MQEGPRAAGGEQLRTGGMMKQSGQTGATSVEPEPHASANSSTRIPRATYRLQFNSRFTFQNASGIADYLSDLGVSDLYASPVFTAAPESTHGYDVCSHERLNEAIGGERGLAQLTHQLRQLGMQILLDIVPNHMGGHVSNLWWRDVLEHGPQSQYASYFDIDWESPDPSLRGKVLLPILGSHYSEVLESGELRLLCREACTAGPPSANAKEELSFALAYYDREFPLNPQSVQALRPEFPVGAEVAPEAFNSINGRPGDARSFDRLHAIVQQQHYRLAYWRLGSQLINYRRFFDVNELVSMRVESDQVFAAMHRVIADMLAQGVVAGLRIDHPDGLWDPLAYLKRLQELGRSATPAPLEPGSASNREADAAAGGRGHPMPPRLYVVVEKILTGREPLPEDWPVNGTTGYDFLNLVNGLFVEGRNGKRFQRLYARFSGVRDDLHETTYKSKKQVLENSFSSEISALARKATAIAHATRYGLDCTRAQIRAVLVALVASFPVYRTYMRETDTAPHPGDSMVIEAALSQAARRVSPEEHPALRLIGDLLLLRFPPDFTPENARSARNFIMRFQQLTGPAMAKGLEDTAFYRFNRLISLNEVGGDPGRFGVTTRDFHEHNAGVARRWPHSLLATATHDTKRGEDFRARLNVLSEMPEEWNAALTEWAAINHAKKTSTPAGSAPSRNDEYYFYQTLLGACESTAALHDEQFLQRLKGCLLKSIREAKVHTSWTDPCEPYEHGTLQFAEQACRDPRFLESFRPFAERVSFFGMWNSLSQVLLKTTSPGVPDFYRGTEFWDFSMVDPDNRRPVDFGKRKDMLRQLIGAERDQRELGHILEPLLAEPETGSIKLFLTWRALRFRAQHEALFTSGSYVPLGSKGAKARHVIAFARTLKGRTCLTVVPRLVYGLTNGERQMPTGQAIWGDTTIRVTAGVAGNRFRDQLTGHVVARMRDLPLGELLSAFPGALLETID